MEDKKKQQKHIGRQLEELTGSAKTDWRGEDSKVEGWCERKEGMYTCTQYNVVANHGKETALHRSHA